MDSEPTLTDTSSDNAARAELFSRRQIIQYGLLFVALVAAANRIVRFIDLRIIHFERPPFWPIGIFEFSTPGLFAIGMAIACFVAFVLAVWRLEKAKYSLPLVMSAGIVLILGTSLIHGVETGLRAPVVGDPRHGPKGEIQYYHDAVDVESAGGFLSHFNEIQPLLGDHSRTHPPGAVLIYYYFLKCPARPEFISLFIAVISTVLSSIFLNGILLSWLPNRTIAGYLVMLLLLIPAWQIYGCSSLDALIASLFTGTICFLSGPRGPLQLVGMALCLIGASFLTFAAVFLIPVIFVYERIKRRSVLYSAAALTIVAFAYFALHQFTGFSYGRAFITASRLENPGGFWLVADPASYIFSRLACIGEIMVFIGPFLAVLVWRGLRCLNHADPSVQALVLTPYVILLSMFIVGAFHLGETARACLFILPFILLAIAACVAFRPTTRASRVTLLAVVFAQTLAMQLVGNYYW